MIGPVISGFDILGQKVKMIKPWIENVSMGEYMRRSLLIDPEKTVAIQIVDPDVDFPKSPLDFIRVYQFKFLDVDDPGPVTDKYGIQQEQADTIVEILRQALAEGKNVIVHCHMGVCRSGAVAEVGIMMGFEDTGSWRSPNTRVKGMMLKKLGWTYLEESGHFGNTKPATKSDFLSN